MNNIISKISKIPKKFLIYIIRLYQRFLSPRMGKRCKYYPTCSEYAIIAIDKYGIIKGTIMSVFRILRCNPFSKRWNR